jgi:amino-acid N-acetyltransferase
MGWTGSTRAAVARDDGRHGERVSGSGEPSAGGSITVRPARTDDVPGIRAVVEPLVRRGVLVSKHAVAYYEGLQQFVVAADSDDRVVGCGALHVLWDDLAEVRTLAVAGDYLGRGVGSQLLRRVLEEARERRVNRVFCLTFEVPFFTRHGFVPLDGAPVGPDVYEQLLRSYDVGVAEFLDLDRVKPNTLGNTRMICQL